MISNENLSTFQVSTMSIGILFVWIYIILPILFYCFRFIVVFSNMAIPRNLKTKYGPWAVVTGCTDGIGLAYARELARRGMNVVLISRSRDKLEAAARHIERDFQVETRVVQADFSKDEGRQLYPRIAQQLQHLDVGILVNNVGVLVPYPMQVEEMSEEMIWEHVLVNVVAATQLTAKLLPAMKARGRGAIVNVASTAALKPLPYLCVYAATKVYLEFFSRALREECRGCGLTVQTLVPYYVNTKMIDFSASLRSGGIMVPSAKTYARHALATLGVADYTTGYLPHGVQYWFLSLVPNWIYIPVAKLINHSLRKKYDKTQESSHL